MTHIVGETRALPPALAELVRRVRQQWSGKVVLDYKDGHVEIRQAKGTRGEKQHDRVD